MLDRLKQLMTRVLGPSEACDAATMESEIFRDLGLNSVRLLYLVLAIEEEFGVTLTNENISAFRTVGDICSYLQANAKK